MTQNKKRDNVVSTNKNTEKDKKMQYKMTVDMNSKLRYAHFLIKFCDMSLSEAREFIKENKTFSEYTVDLKRVIEILKYCDRYYLLIELKTL